MRRLEAKQEADGQKTAQAKTKAEATARQVGLTFRTKLSVSQSFVSVSQSVIRQIRACWGVQKWETCQSSGAGPLNLPLSWA